MAERNAPGGGTPDGQRADAAAAWILKSDRGLTAAEQDAFSEWLAADPRHRAELARHRGVWQRLDRLGEWRPEHGAGPNPDLLAAPLPSRWRVMRRPAVRVTLAAALLVLAALPWLRRHAPVPAPEPATGMAAADRAGAGTAGLRPLADGSLVEANHGARLVADFDARERRVTLDAGEAHFTVRRDATRPFVVRAAGVEVRAVGTAFNVRVAAGAVEVLVTEGRVEVAAADGRPAGLRPTLARLEARQRAVVPLGANARAVEVATLTPGEIDRVLAWQHRLLDFTAQPLREIVAEFNRRNEVQLVVVDAALAETRVSATLRSDNVEGLVRLLEAGFRVRRELRGEREIILRTER